MTDVPPRSPPSLPTFCVVVDAAFDVSALDVAAEALAEYAGASEATLDGEADALDASTFEDVGTLDAPVFAEVVGASFESEDSLDETPLSSTPRFSDELKRMDCAPRAPNHAEHQILSIQVSH